MRQQPGGELPFVSLTQGSSTTVNFASGTATGKYILDLDFIDKADASNPIVYEIPFKLNIYSYERPSPIKTLHEFRADYPLALTIENLVFYPPLGTSVVNMRLAKSSDL